MDLDIYTTEMSKSVWDKAFFMDKIPGVKCVIDFGCADGAMIRYLAPLFPDITFVGYDISRELIARACTTSPYYANLTYFVGDIGDGAQNVYDYVSTKFKPEEICLNFSSVLHEVFSSTGGINTIQRLLDELKPRYITIRDMYCDDPIKFNSSSTELVPMINFIVHKYENRSLKIFDDYATRFGKLKDWRDWAQFLMKIQWIDNGWEEELKEDYFSWTLDMVLKLWKTYSPVFECRYQLPYLSEKWKEELGWFNPDVHTHAQFILRRDD